MDINNILTYLNYIILIITGISILSLLIILNINNNENFGNTVVDDTYCKDTYGYNYVSNSTNTKCVPNFAHYCGAGTTYNNTECIVDNDAIVNNLINNKFVQYLEGDVVFIPEYNDMDISPMPTWYETWLNEGGYEAERVISWGFCNVSDNCNAPCRCGDCAGWRGGNSTDCDSNTIGTGRVFCNLQPGIQWTFSGEPDKCECEYGYVAINGLCVSPFKSQGTTPSTRCCPNCIFYPPREGTGGCNGSMTCDTSNICEEQKVTLPGTKVNIDINNNKVKVINKLCSESSNDDCYDPNNIDARKRQPYILISPSGNDLYDNLVQKDTNIAHGQNEYECARECGNTVNNQVECSKRCLPQLWRWYPVFENMEDSGNMRYTGDYYQSDELMRYLPSDAQLLYCPSGTCETEQNIPDISIFNNCVDCDNCDFIYSGDVNNNGFSDRKYICDNCKTCNLTQQSQLGDLEVIKCNDMTNCNNCVLHTTSLNPDGSEGIYGLTYNDCDSCNTSNPNNSKSGCKVYTLDPYILHNGNVEFHPGAIIYNHGADPGKNYTNTTIENGYDPSTRWSKCDFPWFPGKLYCDNTLNGNIGWGDGYLDEVANCIDGCSDDTLL